jgi:hypothetical protein
MEVNPVISVACGALSLQVGEEEPVYLLLPSATHPGIGATLTWRIQTYSRQRAKMHSRLIN